MQCPVHGCRQVLGDDGRPLEYCDWQQGRCPMQKHKLDLVGSLTLVAMFVMLGLVIWLTI